MGAQSIAQTDCFKGVVDQSMDALVNERSLGFSVEYLGLR